MKRARFTYTTEIEHDDGDRQEVTVNYNVSGRYLPATFDEPAEFPEIDIVSIVSDGEDVTGKLSGDHYSIILDEIRESVMNP